MTLPHRLRKKLNRSKWQIKPDQLLASILLLFWLAILLGNFVFRGQFVFEGTVIAQEISFTYTGQQDKRFLNPIREIRNLDLEGSQSEPLVLIGKLSSMSSNDPTLNQKLSKLDKLTIQLAYAKSRFIVSPVNPNSSELSILELKLMPDSRVNQLAYNPKAEQLSFCLQIASRPSEICLFPDNLVDQSTESVSTSIGNLQLSLGQQPLTVTLALVNIPELGIKADVNSPEEITFQFTPTNDELVLPVHSPSHLFIDFPKLPSVVDSQPDISAQWIRGDIDVENVKFIRFDTTSDVTDELKDSTILDGEIRMGRETMKLQADQFLVPQSQPGIQKLRYIQLHSKSPQGLKTLFAGRSTGIAIGLYPEFPVQKLEPSWLSQYLSQEGVNALLAFVAAVTGVVLPRLLLGSSK